MAYSITDVKNAVSRKLHGTTANQLTDFYGLLFDTASKCIDDCDFEETRRTAALTTPIYGQAAFDYACPTDLKGNRLIDLRPTANRLVNDVPTQQNSQDFDRLKTQIASGSRVEVRWNKYGKTLRISLPETKKTLLNSCDSLTCNGTWSAGGGATGIATETLYTVDGTGSIRFDLSAGWDGDVINTTMTPVDLTDYEDKGVIFLWLYCQSNTPTSLTLSWGTDTTVNYWYRIISTQWDGTAFQQGWNLIGFDWGNATEIGSPDITLVDSIRLDVHITGTAIPMYLDQIVISLGEMYEIEYYSKYLFRDTAGAFKEKPTADSDLLNLDSDSYGVFTNCLAMLAAQQQQGKDAAFDLPFFQNQYKESVLSYNQKYPSQAQKTVGSYYDVKRSSYATKLGGVTLRP